MCESREVIKNFKLYPPTDNVIMNGGRHFCILLLSNAYKFLQNATQTVFFN